MSAPLALATVLAAGVLVIPAAAPFVAPVVAQGGLARLGLSDARARTTRAPEEGSYDDIGRRPILLWLDGLEQP